MGYGLFCDAELFEKAGWYGLKMRVSMNERDIQHRRGCGNQGIHDGEALLAGLANLPRTRGGAGLKRFDGNDVRNFLPAFFK